MDRANKNFVSPPHVPPPKHHQARRQLLNFSSSTADTPVFLSAPSARREKLFADDAASKKLQPLNSPLRPSTASGERLSLAIDLSKASLRPSTAASDRRSVTSRRQEVDSLFSKPFPSARSAAATAASTRGLGGRALGLSSSTVRQETTADFLTASTRSDALLSILAKTDRREVNEIDILSSSENGDILGVMRVLKSGAHPDAHEGLNSYRPLHYAASAGHLAIVERLLFFGADIESLTGDGENAMILASYKGHHNIVELLLDKGANVNASNKFGDTPLFYAARRGYPTVVRLLMERGADAKAKNRFGDTAVEDCEDERTIIAFQDVKTIQPTSGGPAKCLVGKLLLHVLSFMSPKTLCRAAQVNGMWHGKASHSELWKKLGVSRWEMAMRTSVSQLNGGFAVAPFLASYRPNAKKIKPGEKRTSTSKLGTGSYGQNGGAPSEVSAKENFFVKAVPGVGESETKPQRTQVAGFSVDFF
jgi:hypothetical protein